MPEADGALVLGPRSYRWLDRGTKLAGVALVAFGLEVGGHTAAGLALGAAGAALALGTVLVEPAPDPAAGEEETKEGATAECATEGQSTDDDRTTTDNATTDDAATEGQPTDDDRTTTERTTTDRTTTTNEDNNE